MGQRGFRSELDGALGHRQGILRVMLLHSDDSQAHEGQRAPRCQLHFLAQLGFCFGIPSAKNQGGSISIVKEGRIRISLQHLLKPHERPIEISFDQISSGFACRINQRVLGGIHLIRQQRDAQQRQRQRSLGLFCQMAASQLGRQQFPCVFELAVQVEQQCQVIGRDFLDPGSFGESELFRILQMAERTLEIPGFKLT